MSIHHESSGVTLHHGDCLDVLRSLPDASVDSVVTDPPYGLGFMGKDWDKAAILHRPPSADSPTAVKKYPETGRGPGAVAFDGHAFQQWCEQWTAECLRVLKPGGHLLAFGGTRTWHRLACAVEDAGFEVRDSLAWLYGSGFPKSLDVSKAIDKAAGAEREVVGERQYAHGGPMRSRSNMGAVGNSWRWGDEWHRWEDLPATAVAFYEKTSDRQITAPATDAAREWAGWGTALKPAFEPVVVARKPLTRTVAGNVQQWGTGALNIDGCRIGTTDTLGRTNNDRDPASAAAFLISEGKGGTFDRSDVAGGRWPANVILDEVMAGVLDEQSGTQRDGVATNRNRDASELASDAGWGFRKQQDDVGYGGQGGASRFFYVAKAPKKERPNVDGTAHPTVKPLALMRWLVRLVTPPGGTVLEPFAGSGTTVEACIVEGFRCVAIEREADYLPLILERIHRQGRARIEAEVARETDPDAAILDQLGAKKGRWPANVLLDPEMAAVLDEQSGVSTSKSGGKTTRLGTGGIMNPAPPGTPPRTGHDDEGGASRFFAVMPYDEPTLFDGEEDTA